MAEFQFYSDTNQRIFEDDLDQYGVEYRCVAHSAPKSR